MSKWELYKITEEERTIITGTDETTFDYTFQPNVNEKDETYQIEYEDENNCEANKIITLKGKEPEPEECDGSMWKFSSDPTNENTWSHGDTIKPLTLSDGNNVIIPIFIFHKENDKWVNYNGKDENGNVLIKKTDITVDPVDGIKNATVLRQTDSNGAEIATTAITENTPFQIKIETNACDKAGQNVDVIIRIKECPAAYATIPCKFEAEKKTWKMEINPPNGIEGSMTLHFAYYLNNCGEKVINIGGFSSNGGKLSADLHSDMKLNKFNSNGSNFCTYSGNEDKIYCGGQEAYTQGNFPLVISAISYPGHRQDPNAAYVSEIKDFATDRPKATIIYTDDDNQ